MLLIISNDFGAPALLAALSDVDPIVWLLPLVAAYATWRAVVYAKQKRWAIFIPVVFVIAVCLFEFSLQLYRGVFDSQPTTPAVRQIDGDPGGSTISLPPGDDSRNEAENHAENGETQETPR